MLITVVDGNPMTRKVLSMIVNGKEAEILVAPHWTLLQVLRDELGLLGTKKNCLEAECGVCTVLMDGKAVNSCILLALQCRQSRIETIEGLSKTTGISPLQQAFIDHGAVQCGYCIPGMLMTAQSLLDENVGRVLSRDEIREGICGTLCRCTGYQKIVEAILAESQRRNGLAS